MKNYKNLKKLLLTLKNENKNDKGLFLDLFIEDLRIQMVESDRKINMTIRNHSIGKDIFVIFEKNKTMIAYKPQGFKNIKKTIIEENLTKEIEKEYEWLYNILSNEYKKLFILEKVKEF